MKYRIGKLIHDCPEAKGRPDVYWDRGYWFIGIDNITGTKQTKCRYCKKALYDPLRVNRVSTGSTNLYSYALKQIQEYPAIYVEKVDLRKKEFK